MLVSLRWRTISPRAFSVTRLSGSGRSSDVSQKSSACRAMVSSGMFGFHTAQSGASPFSISPSDLPSVWMCPRG